MYARKFLTITAAILCLLFFKGDLAFSNGREIKVHNENALLSTPVHNSTFTVDSTGDGADAAIDGLCADSGGKCTLRAAITEANATAGPHTINFNIPTSDPGYVDYDGGVGDSNGDDNWVITPATVLPTITSSGVSINGATQTTNQGNFNTTGPEIQIRGTLIGTLIGLNFSSSATSSSVNSLVVSEFATQISISADNVTVTNSYFNVDPKSLGTYAVKTTGINIGTVTGTVIGNNISDGNVIGRNSNGINIACGAAGAKTLTIRGNYIGISKDAGYTAAGNTTGIPISGDCVAMIGGDSSTHRNYFASNTRAIISSLSASDVPRLELYNNYFGTDPTGTLDRRHTSRTLDFTGANYVGAVTQIFIGAENKGNLFRFTTLRHINMNSSCRNTDVGFNTFADADSAGVQFANAGGLTYTTNIHDNFFGYSTADPYFGVATNPNKSHNIWLNDGNGYTVENNTVDANHVTGGLAGIVTVSQLSTDITIRGNTINKPTSTGIQVASSDTLIENNNITNSLGSHGILVQNTGSTPATNVTIRNNISNSNFFTGVRVVGSTATIEGNETNDNGWFGIFSANGNENGRTNNSDDLYVYVTIGGTGALIGSRCNGTEANCIEGNLRGGISTVNAMPVNESTIFTDNSFGTGNDAGGNFDVKQEWVGLFEIFSGTARRTDLADASLIIPVPEGHGLQTTYVSSDLSISSITNYSLTCLSAADCPASGATSGVDTKSMFSAFSGTTLSSAPNVLVSPWYHFIEYAYNHSGQKVDYNSNTNPMKFDGDHFTSKEFSFDGNSTTQPVVGDRAEPWTDNTLATRTLTAGNLGRFQIMEIEMVDANPVEQDDGSFVITVDSTSDEDNVSIAGFDDGDGAYSGGGTSGPGGIANGKTSLREAIIVANNFSQPVKIEFNIPETDTGFINPNGSRTSTAEAAGTYPVTPYGYFRITTATDLTITDRDGLTIDGYSIPNSSRNTADFGSTLNTILRIQVERTTAGTTFVFSTGSNVHMTGMNIRSVNGGSGIILVNASSNSDNNWFEGMYMGSNINGKNDLAVSGKITYTSNCDCDNNILGTNGDGINDAGELNVITGRSTQAMIGFVGDSIALQSSNIRMSGNYIRTDNTGKVCFNGDTSRSAVTINGNAWGSLIGTDEDGVSDNLESNIIGCGHVAGNVRGALLAQSSNISVIGNYINTAPDGTSLIDQEDTNRGSIETASGTSGVVIRNNVIRGFSTGSGIREESTGAVIEGNEIFGAGVAGIVFRLSPSGAQVVNNRIHSNSGKGIQIPSTSTNNTLLQNFIFDNTGIAINLAGGTEDVHGVTINDAEDTDTGANELMNAPIIETVAYLGASKYRVSGSIDDNDSERPITIEVCKSSNHSTGNGDCITSYGTVETSDGNWSMDVTETGSDGIETEYFSAVATNAGGSTGEFSSYFTADSTNSNYFILQYPITLTYPIDGNEITDRTPLLDWTVTGDPDIDHYDIYLSHDSSSNLVKIGEIDKEGTNFQISDNSQLNYTTYYWQVIGIRENGTEGGRSEIESFQVVRSLSDLTLLYPIGGIEIDERKPMFSWSKSTNPETKYYKIYLTKEGKKEILLGTIQGRENTTFQPTEELEFINYSWRVVGYYVDGEVSGQSVKETFRVIDPETILPPQTGGPDSEEKPKEDKNLIDRTLGEKTFLEQLGIVTVVCILPLALIILIIILILKKKKKKKEEVITPQKV